MPIDSDDARNKTLPDVITPGLEILFVGIELQAGCLALVAKVKKARPRKVAFLGLSAYRVAFGRPKVSVGRQEVSIGGSETWVLPNPSGLNAHYQLADLAREYAALRD